MNSPPPLRKLEGDEEDDGVLVAMDIARQDIIYRCYRRHRRADDDPPLDPSVDDGGILPKPHPKIHGDGAQHMVSRYRPLCWCTEVMRLDLEEIFEAGPEEAATRLLQVALGIRACKPPLTLPKPRRTIQPVTSCL